MTVLDIIFLIVFWAWVFSAALFLRNTVLPRVPIPQLPPHAYELPLETVHFAASDGLRLEGWKASKDPARPWLIVCHGVGANRADLLDIAAGLFHSGFNILLFDFRGHGGSSGRATSFGYREQRDLEGALAFLGSQPDIPPTPYGVYGISMGGAVALMVGATDERIGAIAIDSSYANLEGSIERHLHLMYPWLPNVPFSWFVLSTYRMRFGIWPRHVSPERSAAELGRRPLLVIHGAQDTRMPLNDAKRLITQAPGPREFWSVEGAGHLEAYHTDPHAYLARLIRFFETSLR